jgi:hypothetical protein
VCMTHCVPRTAVLPAVVAVMINVRGLTMKILTVNLLLILSHHAAITPLSTHVSAHCGATPPLPTANCTVQWLAAAEERAPGCTRVAPRAATYDHMAPSHGTAM